MNKTFCLVFFFFVASTSYATTGADIKKLSKIVCDGDGVEGTVTAVNANGTLRVSWPGYNPSIQQDPRDCENITPIPGKVIDGFKKNSKLICEGDGIEGTVTAVNANGTLRISWPGYNPSIQQDPRDCENITPIPGKVVYGFKKNSKLICEGDGIEGTVTAVNADGTLRVSWVGYNPTIQQDPRDCENITILGGDNSDRGVSHKDNLSPSYQNSTGTSSAHAQ